MSEKITIEKNGKKVACDILFTFSCDETGKAYVGYTDQKVDEKNRKNIYVSAFDPILGMGQLEEITTDAERQMIEEVLHQIRKDAGTKEAF